jgi:Tfp pilus assembly ATPase PilU
MYINSCRIPLLAKVLHRTSRIQEFICIGEIHELTKHFRTTITVKYICLRIYESHLICYLRNQACIFYTALSMGNQQHLPYPSNEENLQDQDISVFHDCEKFEIS